jgi:radical SAM superfamily enzyme YgiQ (UPF0313 family)
MDGVHPPPLTVRSSHSFVREQRAFLHTVDCGHTQPMKVLLICANTETMNILPLPLGPALVAAAVRAAGHDAVLLNLMFEQNKQSAIQDRITELRPEVVGISVRNIDDQNMADPAFLLPPVREVVRTCRSACNAPIVLGGAGYSIFPESALRYLGADMGIQGEGETTFPLLLERMAKGVSVSGLPGLYLPGQQPPGRTFVMKLDSLPLPEPNLWIPSLVHSSEVWIPVQSRRGCPLDCSFCSTSIIEGRPVRKHSHQALLAWVEQLVGKGFTQFHFVDNTFNLPPCYAKELCRRIVETGLQINIRCIVYPKWVDAELVNLMARAGCCEVALGFESGSETTLRSINKLFTPEEVRTVSRMFADAGVFRRGFLLLGGPGETKETVEESLAFGDSLNLDALKITVGLRIYPGTPLAAAALAEKVIWPGDDLLWPSFYLAPGLVDWLPERIAAYRAARSWAA